MSQTDQSELTLAEVEQELDAGGWWAGEDDYRIRRLARALIASDKALRYYDSVFSRDFGKRARAAILPSGKGEGDE